MMRRLGTPALFFLLLVALPLGAQTTATKSAAVTSTATQQVFLRETGDSPTKSKLTEEDRLTSRILITQIGGDKKRNVLERWWNGKRIRWIDENGDMRPTDAHGDQVEDILQIDRDGDGYLDGPGDMTIDWTDTDRDGDADIQSIVMHPKLEAKSTYAGESHWMLFLDLDDDNVHGYIDWNDFDLECWRITDKGNFSPDYNGNSIFLKEHYSAASIEDPAYSWENPFAFYDTDGDGVTEMAIRFCDSRTAVKPGDESAGVQYDGKIEESFLTFDLDNDAQRDNEMDFDMSVRFADGERLDYNAFVNEIPQLKGEDWVTDLMRYPNWKMIDRLVYVPHEKCLEEMLKPKWGKAYFVFDEDDDDHRWERVEILYPSQPGRKVAADPYLLSRWDGKTTPGLNGHPQSDMLGDRGEFDEDFSGKGQLYVGPWDRKFHLVGAEWGACTVDRDRKYWGSWPVVGGSSKAKPTAVEEVVHYRDTNNDGFFDEVRFDYDGDRVMELTLDLKALGALDRPIEQISLSGGWESMHKLFNKIAEENWQHALQVYQAAWKAGLLETGDYDLSIASSLAEKYDKAYWLREAIFRRMIKLSKDDQALTENVMRAHVSDSAEPIVKLIGSRSWN